MKLPLGAGRAGNPDADSDRGGRHALGTIDDGHVEVLNNVLRVLDYAQFYPIPLTDETAKKRMQ
ncbi:MAG: hypothetical protein ACLSFJ_06680 [Holdemania filiformis]